MNAEILKIMSQVAGIGGLALGVLLLLFRDVIRLKVFPQLSKVHAFKIIRLILLLVWFVALAGIAAWVWLETKRSQVAHATLKTEESRSNQIFIGSNSTVTIHQVALSSYRSSSPDLTRFATFRSARFIPGSEKGSGVLEIIMENLTKTMIPLTEVEISGKTFWPYSCGQVDPEMPWQTVHINWRKIMSKEGRERAWTNLAAESVGVEVHLKLANCGHPFHYLRIRVPVQSDLPPMSTTRLTFRIHEIAGEDPPGFLKDWDSLAVSVEPSSVVHPARMALKTPPS